ncbi:MAG TPA: amino acid racemase [Firmicutes bacterium]|nr:amino acid racemase [Bacillota bacterium]
MKIPGLVGGTGWVSTAEYYRLINIKSNQRLGDLKFAKLLIYSLNYGDIEVLNRTGNREGVYRLVEEAALKLEKGGADGIVLCANTLHQFSDRLESILTVPIIHIADAVARAMTTAGIKKCGLLGTKQTMEMDFYIKRLQEQDITVIVPAEKDRNEIQRIISGELLKNSFKKESRMFLEKLMEKLVKRGAGGIVLGCTELPLLLKKWKPGIPLFNTLEIHAQAVVDFALEEYSPSENI